MDTRKAIVNAIVKIDALVEYVVKTCEGKVAERKCREALEARNGLAVLLNEGGVK